LNILASAYRGYVKAFISDSALWIFRKQTGELFGEDKLEDDIALIVIDYL
jgi:hypothetical protein